MPLHGSAPADSPRVDNDTARGTMKRAAEDPRSRGEAPGCGIRSPGSKRVAPEVGAPEWPVRSQEWNEGDDAKKYQESQVGEAISAARASTSD